MKILWYEFKNCFNKVSFLALGLLLLLAVSHSIIFLSLQWEMLNSDGTMVKGISSFKAYTRSAKELEGIINNEYLTNIKREYNSSFEKEYLENHRGFLGTGGIVKYIETNYLLNFPRMGINESNGNENMSLDLDYLKDADSFYKSFKETSYHSFYDNRELQGYHPLSTKADKQLKSRIQNIKTPFRMEPTSWLSDIKNYVSTQYFLVFLTTPIALASIFTRDGINFVSDIGRVSYYGRNKYISFKFLAGLLFSATYYVIYFLTMALLLGFIYGFEGWNASGQVFDHFLIYNFKAGTTLLIFCFGGLCGVLCLSSVVMFLSILTKKFKSATLLALGAGYGFIRLNQTNSLLKLLNPYNFKTELLGDHLIILDNLTPYIIVVIVLSIIYIILMYVGVMILSRGYRW